MDDFDMNFLSPICIQWMRCSNFNITKGRHRTTIFSGQTNHNYSFWFGYFNGFQQLGTIKGLGDIIVSPGIEPGYHIVGSGQGRQQQARRAEAEPFEGPVEEHAARLAVDQHDAGDRGVARPACRLQGGMRADLLQHVGLYLGRMATRPQQRQRRNIEERRDDRVAEADPEQLLCGVRASQARRVEAEEGEVGRLSRAEVWRW